MRPRATCTTFVAERWPSDPATSTRQPSPSTGRALLVLVVQEPRALLVLVVQQEARVTAHHPAVRAAQRLDEPHDR
jgi:hypothetical protein